MKIIFNIAKYIGAFVTIGTVMWFAFTGYTNINDGIGDIKSDMAVMKDSISIVDAKVDTGIAIGEANSAKIDANTSSVNAVTSSYVNYIQRDESLTREEFFDVIGPWLNDVNDLKKKTSLNPGDSTKDTLDIHFLVSFLPELSPDLILTVNQK